ncbi:MAG TPA: YihY/virulence factor BrkB family protein [Caulobacteraceae bacterium]|nr:YihY/virulence factor BrkB family protein [Caulobacteraceae bacterium]
MSWSIGSLRRWPMKMLPWLGMAALAALYTRERRGRPETPGEPAIPTAADFDAADPGRGRCARWPWQIPPRGWKDIFWRFYLETGRTRLPALAGGVTYYLLLATFPAIAAFVSVYGLFSNLKTVEGQLGRMALVVPGDAVSLIQTEMVRLATQKQATLGVAFAVSTLASIWSANAGMKSLFDGLNIVYEEREKRPYLPRTLLTYAVTFATVLFVAATTLVATDAPLLFKRLGVHRSGPWWDLTRWLLIWLMATAMFAVLYRIGPSRRPARWRWVFPGAAAAALLWIGGSLGFSSYLDHFTHFGVTYGSIGAMIAYMLWVWLSVVLILTGGELNSEIEHQTAVDTTIGTLKPFGARGAAMADTVGKAFKVSPREARHWVRDFLLRQVHYVLNFARRAAGKPLKPLPGSPAAPPGPRRSRAR